eukprot:scaffold106089_cov26-Tisochrysis_lutea.AAC.4
MRTQTRTRTGGYAACTGYAHSGAHTGAHTRGHAARTRIPHAARPGSLAHAGTHAARPGSPARAGTPAARTHTAHAAHAGVLHALGAMLHARAHTHTHCGRLHFGLAGSLRITPPAYLHCRNLSTHMNADKTSPPSPQTHPHSYSTHLHKPHLRAVNIMGH